MAKKNKNSIKWHLVIIGVLFIVFIALLILSSSSESINSKTTFEPEIVVSDDDVGDYFLGKIDISNNGYLPSRYVLPLYVACYYKEDEIIGGYTQQVYYADSDVSFQRSLMMDNGYRVIDLKSNEELSIDLNVYGYSPIKTLNGGKINLTDGARYELRVFEIDKDEIQFTYNYCNYAKDEKLVKIINLRVEDNVENE